MKPLLARSGLLISLLVFVMAAGTIGFTVVEHLSLFDAFYLTVVTVATVGYGDVHPVTQAGRVVAIFVIVAGVGTFSGVVVNSASVLFERRQDAARRERTNVLIGLFFSEVGSRLLALFVPLDPGGADLRQDALVQPDWTERRFVALRKRVQTHAYALDPARMDFSRLRTMLAEKTDFLLRLIESPSLIEHEGFTELLRATVHLREELSVRDSFEGLPQTDVTHLTNDAKRVYSLLVGRWVDHMRYLQKAYPYLFSLALRNNPFDEKRSPIVR